MLSCFCRLAPLKHFFNAGRVSCCCLCCTDVTTQVMSMCFPLQVDYESEDEGEGDDANTEEKEDQEAGEAENTETTAAEEPRPEFAEPRLQRSSTRPQRVDESVAHMRVNSVLESNSAFEGYRFDLKHELWCEVSVSASCTSSIMYICIYVCMHYTALYYTAILLLYVTSHSYIKMICSTEYG